MKIKNQTEIQLMKILFKTSKKKPTKNITSHRAYPHGVERNLYNKLRGFYKPLTDYVSKYVNEHMEALLRGDSGETRLDEIPGESFRDMLYNLENWMSVNMPDIANFSQDVKSNVILASLSKSANEALEFNNREFEKVIEKGIKVKVPISSSWWDDMKNSWAENNYTLITSNAKNYISKINTLTEQAITNGLAPSKLKSQLFQATQGLTEKHCKLLARDQIGKLNGQIIQNQMQELGLDMYVWSTANDDRVRDSHAVMEGLLCRWDDASVCSYDNGKTWVPRPGNAIDLHPGQDIQCRCVGTAFYPELISEVEDVPMSEITSDLPPVQDLSEFNDDIEREKIIDGFISDGLNSENEDFKNFIKWSFQETELDYCKVMRKIVSENKQSINYLPSNGPSFFSMSNKTIQISNLNRSTTLRHESAHFLDNLLGFDAKLHWKYDNEYTRTYHFSFSKSKEFSEVYSKELKNMTSKIKKDIKLLYDSGELSPTSSYLFGNDLSYLDVKTYLSHKGYELNDEEFLSVLDMFTASTKKSFGGHSVSYFKDVKRVSSWPELKNECVLLEGFAELTESLYNKNMTGGMKKFLNDYFSDSIPIIKKKIEEYIL